MGNNITITKELQQAFAKEMMFEYLRRDDFENFQLCLKKGADLQTRNSAGQTPLLWAVAREASQKWIDFLLGNEPDFTAMDSAGKNVIDHAKAITDPMRRQKLLLAILKILPDIEDDFNEAAHKQAQESTILTRDIQSVPAMVFNPKKSP